uniref:Nucleoporin Nup54 alpha-helical domain-containing protein n=1 Tax=Timema bartmani TaxID=61472 RepID=A0A7R9I9F8_9NEOP|nr:unnamed protein product [Timema bartmani]
MQSPRVASGSNALKRFCSIKKRSNEANLINSLNAILGSKPNLTVTVESIKSTTETKTQVIIHVLEKGPTGPGRRIPATELAAYLHRMLCQQPSSITAENVLAQIKPDKDQLAEYLEQPPAGIDPRLWKQAQEDNPDRDRYVPVPIIGFGEVCWRLRCQENETRLHQAFLDKVSDDITELQRRLATTKSKTAEYRRKFVELEHRLLKVHTFFGPFGGPTYYYPSELTFTHLGESRLLEKSWGVSQESDGQVSNNEAESIQCLGQTRFTLVLWQEL